MNYRPPYTRQEIVAGSIIVLIVALWLFNALSMGIR
jgi:uncharacterized membrane protein